MADNVGSIRSYSLLSERAAITAIRIPPAVMNSDLPPDDLSRNFVDVSPLDGGQCRVDSFLLSVIRAGGDNCYPYSAGGYEFRNPKSSVESPARRGPRMPLRGAGSSVPL